MSEKSKQNRLQSVSEKVTIVTNMITMTKTDRLSSVLFGKARRGILSLFFSRPEETFYLRQIVQLTGIGLGPIQRELKQLSDAGIIHRKVQGRQVYFQANRECPIFNELKSIIIKTVGVGDALRSALSSLANRIYIAFIYGSFASGEEKKGSDVDLLVIGDITLREVVSSLSEAQHAIGREINPTVYPVEEFKKKIKEKHHFLSSVIHEPAIFLIGDIGELEKMAGKRLADRT
ncbi:MAG: nucleotidyltransferase domain-containing protein [Proteobacteria bacterium]|nr:nucleotidyltransferase domain-containing protein [Pseudomonadota bacterium]